MKQPENNEQDGNSKFLLIKNYFKCKWIKLSNQRAQNGWKRLKTHTQLQAASKTSTSANTQAHILQDRSDTRSKSRVSKF